MSSTGKLTLAGGPTGRPWRGGFGRVVIVVSALLLICATGASDKPKPTTGPIAVRVEGDRIITPDGWFARPKVRRPPLPEKITNAFVIPIHGVIQDSTLDAVKRKVIKCKSSGAQMVIFDIKTPGGSLKAMLGIVEQILDELPGVTTVAYVNPRAISAGAIVSLACHEIVMSPRAIIGDAMPVMMGPQGYVPIPKAERAKIESYTLAELRLVAKERGHNLALCQAMVTLNIEAWLIRNIKTRELKVVNARNWRHKVAGAPIEPSLNIPAPEDAQWEWVHTVVGLDKLATLTTDEAVRAGLALHVFENMEALEKHYNITVEMKSLEDTGTERIVGFLTSQIVMSILMFVGILAIYAELHSPGFGVAGAIAIVCFAIVFGSQYLTGLAQWWEIALFFVGVLLLLVEILLIPGFGVTGVAGILCCIAALLAMLIPNAPTEFPWPQTEGAWEMFKTGALCLMGAFVAATIAAAALARFLPKVPIASRLVLAAPEGSLTAPTTEDAPILDVRPGQVGEVTQTCRPVGKVRIGGRLVDAIADGAFIEAGAEVVVLRNEGNRVVIEAKA